MTRLKNNKRTYSAFSALLLAGSLMLAGCSEKNGDVSRVPMQTDAEGNTVVASETETSVETETQDSITAFEMALMTDGSRVNDAAEAVTAWSALNTYAETYGISHRQIRPESAGQAAYENAFSELLEQRCTTVVLAGGGMESFFYEMQTAHPEIQLILINGDTFSEAEPSHEYGENSTEIRFEVREPAYLAGYAAAATGYRSITLLFRDKDFYEQNFASGFLEGFNAGILDKSSDESAASEGVVNVMTVPSDISSENRRNLIESFIERNTLVVAADRELSIEFASAGANTLPMIAADSGAMTLSASVIAGISYDASASVAEILSESGDGGPVVHLKKVGLGEGVDLQILSAQLYGMTTEEFQTLKEQIAAGEVSVSDVDVYSALQLESLTFIEN